MIEKLECVLVGELHHWVLERSYLLEHLVRYLWIQTNSAMLKLVEWRIKCLIDAYELFFESF